MAEFVKMQISYHLSFADNPCYFDWFGDFRGLRFCALTSVGALFLFNFKDL